MNRRMLASLSQIRRRLRETGFSRKGNGAMISDGTPENERTTER